MSSQVTKKKKEKRGQKRKREDEEEEDQSLLTPYLQYSMDLVIIVITFLNIVTENDLALLLLRSSERDKEKVWKIWLQYTQVEIKMHSETRYYRYWTVITNGFRHHCEDGPADWTETRDSEVDSDSEEEEFEDEKRWRVLTRCWKRQGVYHRNELEGPAYIRYNENGTKTQEEYHLNDKCHREHGPAIIRYDETGQIIAQLWYYENHNYMVKDINNKIFRADCECRNCQKIGRSDRQLRSGRQTYTLHSY